MSEYTTKIIKNLEQSLHRGEIILESMDGVPWVYYVLANTISDGKIDIVGNNLPTWDINHIGTISNLLDEYLDVARKFYHVYKVRYNLYDEEHDKKLIFDLMINATNFDLANFEQYIEKRTQMLTTPVKLGKMSLGAIQTQFGSVELYAEIAKIDSKLEGPYKFSVLCKNELGEFHLPAITFGFVDKTCYMYAIQGSKQKEESVLAKKLDRYFRKFNKDIDPEDITGQVSPNALASATIFMSYLKSVGIKDVIAPVFLPSRYVGAFQSSERKKVSEEERQNLRETIDRNQFNMTNRFSYTLARYAEHFGQDKFVYNDVLEEIHLALSSVYDKRDDNEIYTFRSQIDNNLMSNQISK